MNDETMLHPDPNVHQARKKWLSYLRESGRKKMTGRLINPADNESRCCLGHACHVLGAESAYDSYRKKENKRIIGYKSKGRQPDMSVLPRDICIKLDISREGRIKTNITTDVPGLNDKVTCGDLATLNDHTTYSMNEIADIIEELMKQDALMSFYQTPKRNPNLKNIYEFTKKESAMFKSL